MFDEVTALGGSADLAARIAEAEAIVDAPERLKQLREAKARGEAQQLADGRERDELAGKLGKQRDAYRAEFIRLLDSLDRTPPYEAGALVEGAYVAARQWFALASSLAGALGERCRDRWDGSGLIELHSPQGWRAFWNCCGGRPPKLTPEQQPWLDDLARLRQLVGPTPTRIGNGG